MTAENHSSCLAVCRQVRDGHHCSCLDPLHEVYNRVLLTLLLVPLFIMLLQMLNLESPLIPNPTHQVPSQLMDTPLFDYCTPRSHVYLSP